MIDFFGQILIQFKIIVGRLYQYLLYVYYIYVCISDIFMTLIKVIFKPQGSPNKNA